MQDRIYLGVRNHETGEFYVTACTVPVHIGRQHDVNNQVLLDPKYRSISRMHGLIRKSQRGFDYVDSSSSGSRIGGLLVRDSRVSLPPMFKIEIENYTIERIEAEPLVILVTDSQLTELGKLELLPGRGIGITAGQSGLEITDLNRWTEWDKPQVARFELSEGQPIIMIEDSQRALRRNKSMLTAPRTSLASLDVIEIDNRRFEVLHPGEHRIVCGFDRCHLLNPPPLEANCRFCGRHLANAGGFSRIV